MATMIILDSFKCAAKDLTHPSLMGWTIVLRLEGDADEPIMWHPVKTVSYHMLQGVRALTVAFHDHTPDTVLNETDEVEFAVPRPITGIPTNRGLNRHRGAESFGGGDRPRPMPGPVT